MCINQVVILVTSSFFGLCHKLLCWILTIINHCFFFIFETIILSRSPRILILDYQRTLSSHDRYTSMRWNIFCCRVECIVADIWVTCTRISFIVRVADSTSSSIVSDTGTGEVIWPANLINEFMEFTNGLKGINEAIQTCNVSVHIFQVWYLIILSLHITEGKVKWGDTIRQMELVAVGCLLPVMTAE